MLTCGLTSNVSAHEFNWDNLAFASIKLDKNYDVEANVDWYMEEYRPDTWKSSRNDEFEFQEKREETRRIFQQRIDNFDVNQTFVLRASFDLRDYDFSNQEFPVERSGPDSFWYEYSGKSSETLPSRLKVFMKNHEFVSAVPMSRDAAKAFIQSRKDRNGGIDRKVYAIVEFRLIKLRTEGELVAEALKVTHYRTSARRQPLGPTLIWEAKSSTGRKQESTNGTNDVLQSDDSNHADLSVLGSR